MAAPSEHPEHAEHPGQAESDVGSPVVTEESLVEEISIDGMCGVY